jgi:hypothetical protein
MSRPPLVVVSMLMLALSSSRGTIAFTQNV